MQSDYKIIVCGNLKGFIGLNNELMYKIPQDTHNFKSITLGHVVIMGRKTYESLPFHKPLKNRINIVITSDENYSTSAYDNLFIVHSIQEADDLCLGLFPELDKYVIGGGQIYQQYMDSGMVDTIYHTLVLDTKDGDASFPSLVSDYRYREWLSTGPVLDHTANLSYTFTIYKRTFLKTIA